MDGLVRVSKCRLRANSSRVLTFLVSDWSGTTERNQYTFNALTNFAKFTGYIPKIRVGANSEDKTEFDPSVNASNFMSFGARGAYFLLFATGHQYDLPRIIGNNALP
jgi:hypothetical protein